MMDTHESFNLWFLQMSSRELANYRYYTRYMFEEYILHSYVIYVLSVKKQRKDDSR